MSSFGERAAIRTENRPDSDSSTENLRTDSELSPEENDSSTIGMTGASSAR